MSWSFGALRDRPSHNFFVFHYQELNASITWPFNLLFWRDFVHLLHGFFFAMLFLWFLWYFCVRLHFILRLKKSALAIFQICYVLHCKTWIHYLFHFCFSCNCTLQYSMLFFLWLFFILRRLSFAKLLFSLSIALYSSIFSSIDTSAKPEIWEALKESPFIAVDMVLLKIVSAPKNSGF